MRFNLASRDFSSHLAPEVSRLPSTSVVVPTYREAQNLGELTDRLSKLRDRFEAFELIVVDDNSGDGTEEWHAQLSEEKKAWVRLIVRRNERGLSTAVLRGFEEAQFSSLVVMDADLSHPPEKVPEICKQLHSGDTDFVIGSRYVSGGEVEEGWTAFRWVNSKVATLLARPFTSAKDPMSGFFALRRESFLQAKELSPIGYKIGLELIVKSDLKNVREVPIFFADRKRGQSKLNLKEQLNYIRHLRRLANFKYGNWSFFAQFGLVGLSGTFVNLLFLTIFDLVGVPISWAVGFAIWISMTTNFVLNRLITFNYAKGSGLWRQYFGFVLSCGLGAIVNYYVTIELIEKFIWMYDFPQVAAVVGILAGMLINYFTNRYWVFRRT